MSVAYQSVGYLPPIPIFAARFRRLPNSMLSSRPRRSPRCSPDHLYYLMHRHIGLTADMVRCLLLHPVRAAVQQD